jgi:hypothetical protein
MLLSSFLTLLQDEIVRTFSARIRHTRSGVAAVDIDLPCALNRLSAEEAPHRKAVDAATSL